MPHFAKINENNVVTQVIVIDQATLMTGYWGDPSQWIQTSYNTHRGIHYGPDGQPDGGPAFRKNYAGVGYTYDPSRDAFIPPQPYPSWTLEEETCRWLPPVAEPNDGKVYLWNEETQCWGEPVPEENNP